MSFAFLIIASLMEKKPAGHSRFVSAARLVVGLKCYVITLRKLKWAMKARFCYNGKTCIWEDVLYVQGTSRATGWDRTCRTTGASRSSGAKWTVHSRATGKLSKALVIVTIFRFSLLIFFLIFSLQGAPGEKGEKGETGLPGPQVSKNIPAARFINFIAPTQSLIS